MAMVENDSLRLFTFNNFPKGEVIQGIYSRNGGVSPSPWASLNLGGLNGDIRVNVIENRRRIFQNIGRSVESIYDVWQVHSADIICTDQPRPLDAPHKKADGIVTNRSEITLFMRFADCVPILFYEPEKRVVGIAHAGWQGTVKNIAAQTVKKMCDVYGCKAANIYAGIGPSIGPDHYEVGMDVAERVKATLAEKASDVLRPYQNKFRLDLWKTNQLLLQQVGVKHIEVAGICTACHLEDWYSHRGEHGNTGRFGALIALRDLENS
ncbi:MAG TPA: peptidoglycan editing factor PgeF [Longilinea sp.]|nr:peptidoglycan editing factor PgeF [Longilinea sp.]